MVKDKHTGELVRRFNDLILLQIEKPSLSRKYFFNSLQCPGRLL